jgi:hypothetical protein
MVWKTPQGILRHGKLLSPFTRRKYLPAENGTSQDGLDVLGEEGHEDECNHEDKRSEHGLSVANLV